MPMRKVKTIGELVQRLAEEAGLSYYRLSQLSGITRSAISLIANGKRKPDIDTMDYLLQAAGKDWAWFAENYSGQPLAKRG